MFTAYINNSNDGDSNKIISNNGSSVRASFDPPISLDSKKKYQLRLLSANITNCNPNITTKNNKFSHKYNGTTYNKEIPVGLFSLNDLNYIIGLYTTGQNGQQLFAITGNEYNSTINIIFLTANTYINITPDSVLSILGFGTTLDSIGGFLVGGKTSIVTSTQPARLDTTSLILVKCNITNGSYLNGKSNSIIAAVPINVSSGSQIQYAPVHPARNSVYVDKIDNIQIDLLDQSGNYLDFSMNGTATIPEKWNVAIDITEYDPKSIL